MKRRVYSSDLTNEEWAFLSELIPPAKAGGRPRKTNILEVLNAVFYILRVDARGDYCRTIYRAGKPSITIGANGEFPGYGNE
jgi:transposase